MSFKNRSGILSFLGSLFHLYGLCYQDLNFSKGQYIKC